MKDMKRAWRRHKQWVVLKKRMKHWGVWNPKQETEWNKGIRDKVLNEGYYSFLKDTSTPCSCWLCAYYKYDRTPKQDIQKDIWEEIENNIDNI